MNPQPELIFNPDKPAELITHTSEDFFDACKKADNGDYKIETLERVSGRNGAWKIRVRWKE